MLCKHIQTNIHTGLGGGGATPRWGEYFHRYVALLGPTYMAYMHVYVLNTYTHTHIYNNSIIKMPVTSRIVKIRSVYCPVGHMSSIAMHGLLALQLKLACLHDYL